MKRRDFLNAIGGTIAAVGSAGCLFGIRGGNGLELEHVDRPAEFAAIQSSELTPTQTTLVEGALDDGNYTTYGHRPFSDGEYLEFRGAFYQTRVGQTGTKRLARMVLIAEELDEVDEAISVSDLPVNARQPAVLALRLAIVRDREDGREDLPEGYVFRGEEEEGSVWVPEPEPEHEVIEFDDRTFHLRVEERELEEDEYTTTLEPIAASPDEFEEVVEEEFVIDLDAHNLPPEQREIIETAIDEDGYRERGSISSEFNELINLIQNEAPRHDSLIKYEGEHYSWDYWHSD